MNLVVRTSSNLTWHLEWLGDSDVPLCLCSFVLNLSLFIRLNLLAKMLIQIAWYCCFACSTVCLNARIDMTASLVCLFVQMLEFRHNVYYKRRKEILMNFILSTHLSSPTWLATLEIVGGNAGKYFMVYIINKIQLKKWFKRRVGKMIELSCVKYRPINWGEELVTF